MIMKKNKIRDSNVLCSPTSNKTRKKMLRHRILYFHETTLKTIDKQLHDLLLIIIKDDRLLYCRMLYTCQKLPVYFILLCYALLFR